MRTVPLLLLLLASTALADKPKFEIKDGKLVVPSPVSFETGKAVLRPESDATLAYVKAYLDDKSYISLLRIENHSDTTGTEDSNQKLSEQRSLSVARALVVKGIDCKRLIAVGFGSTKPIAANDTAENKAKNRRTEFANAELKGRAIGGMPTDGGGKVAGDVCAK